ncbi:MAG: amidohydrolase family protein [Bacillota bacterium]|nr:amidohydrolase family protein [Bacillota bacterium]
MAVERERETGRTCPRLVIRDAMVVSGRGTPAEGPMDLVIGGGVIQDVIRVDPVTLGRYPSGWRRPEGDYVIDASGMYVMPGIVDTHAHIPTDPSRCGPDGWDYAYRLWLGHGVTTLRTMGFGNEAVLYGHRRQVKEDGTVAIPGLVILHGWPQPSRFTPAQAREEVRRAHEAGADGIKLLTIEPDLLEAICDEARNLGMPAGVGIHLALNSEVDAATASNAGVRTIEHTYGIPEAAIPGVQNFPPVYNEMDELARFRQSGYNWSEAERYPERVVGVLDTMIRNGTAWNPTLSVYEANRDLMRAQRAVWNDSFVTPRLLKNWSPTPGVHASFHFDWRTSDEVAWKEKYRLWMKYLNVFFDRGGTITAGSDAGSLYTLYGFSMVRELELLQEAGFHPLDAVKMATANGASVLGLNDRAWGIRVGAPADLAVVDGNPLENFKVMYGTGVERFLDDRVTKVQAGGVRWTIRGGVVFDARALLQDVQEYVRSLKA